MGVADVDAGSLAMPTDRAWWAQAPSTCPAPTYDGFTRASHYVTMSDGTRLAADLYLPAGLAAGTRIPALVTQTIYGRGLQFRSRLLERLARRLLPGLAELGEDLARYGYATVVVDLRGSGASFGRKRAVLMPDAVSDGVEIVDWIVAQPWSNGKVGATGISALGLAAVWLATGGHPALKAVATRFSIFDIFAGTHPGGLLTANLVGDVGRRLRALDNNRVHEGGGSPMQQAFIRLLVRGNRPVDGDRDGRMLAEAVAERSANEYFDEVIAAARHRDDGPSVDGTPLLDAISPFTHAKEVERSGVAIYCVGGWADGAFSREMVNLHTNLRPSAAGCRLTLGPWDHGAARYRSPALTRSQSPDFDQTADLVRFFDLHLRGLDWGLADEAPVHYFTQVEETWHAAPSWPPPAELRTWYLSSGSTLHDEPPTDSDLVDTVAADGSAGAGERSRFHTPPLGRAAKEGPLATGGLRYRSSPLPADVEVTGHPVATLFVGCDQPNGTVFVYVEDEAPDGSSHLITEGGLLLSLRPTGSDPPYAGFGPWRPMRRADDRPLAVGEVAEVAVELLPVSWLLRAGHRLVVRIASADPDNFPKRLEAAASLEVHRSPTRPSRVVVPVVSR